MRSEEPLTKDSWIAVLERAYAILDDLEKKGFTDHRLRLGGGTVLMFHYQHRLSKDIDLFGYDAQWLSLVSPRLNEMSAALASAYSERANSVKIVMPQGDIDFIVAADIILGAHPDTMFLAARDIRVEQPAEILAKKLFYRAASLKARDIYDLSAAIDLSPETARAAAIAADHKKELLLRRLEELKAAHEGALLKGIVPYDGRPLRHAEKMIHKTRDFLLSSWRG